MKKIIILILLLIIPVFGETIKLEDDSKMKAGTITNWSVLGGSDSNHGNALYLWCGARDGYERFLVWYDTSFTLNIQAGTLWVRLEGKESFISDDDTLQMATAWGKRIYYEGIGGDPPDSGATWSHYNYPEYLWSAAGALGSDDTTGTPFVGELYSYLGTNPANGTWIGLPICNQLNSWPPSGVTGLLIYSYKCVGNNYFRFNSDDEGTSTYRPYIEFTYTIGGEPPDPVTSPGIDSVHNDYSGEIDSIGFHCTTPDQDWPDEVIIVYGAFSVLGDYPDSSEGDSIHITFVQNTTLYDSVTFTLTEFDSLMTSMWVYDADSGWSDRAEVSKYFSAGNPVNNLSFIDSSGYTITIENAYNNDVPDSEVVWYSLTNDFAGAIRDTFYQTPFSPDTFIVDSLGLNTTYWIWSRLFLGGSMVDSDSIETKTTSEGAAYKNIMWEYIINSQLER